jgi:hypothetical protein
MRLRLFERVRRFAHPHTGRFRRRRDRAGEAVRHDRPWEVRPPGRQGETRGQVVTAGLETTGRHRRGGADVAPPPSLPPDPGEPDREPDLREPDLREPDLREPGPPWLDQAGPPATHPGPAARPTPATPARPPVPPPARQPQPRPAASAGHADTVSVGGARARVRPEPKPYGTAPVAPPQTAQAVAGRPVPRGQARPGPDQRSLEAGYLPAQRPPASVRSRLPFAQAHAPSRANQADLRDGRRNTGTLEAVLWRQWDTATYVPDQAVLAVDRLAELPQLIKDKLVAGLDGIFVGPGGVPQLDDMTALSGVPLPSGRATWDACAGAYGERKIVVGTRPSPTPDVMCHEVGHALDDIDAPPGQWQSDSPEFRMLYDQCQPHLASDFHKQRGGLGRKEFFADAFAAIASRQRPALVDMLGGDTRTALNVMLYFNRRYGM